MTSHDVQLLPAAETKKNLKSSLAHFEIDIFYWVSIFVQPWAGNVLL